MSVRTLFALCLSLLTLAIMGQSTCSSGGDDDDLPAGACRSDGDCSSGESCIAPGEFMGCGMCYQSESTCSNDAGCGTGSVCEWDNSPCQCSGPTQQCMPACTATSCPEGQACAANGHCEYISCAAGFTCPDLTTCTPGAPENGCQRWTCTKDSSCGTGNFCVEGLCQSSLGTCMPPVP